MPDEFDAPVEQATAAPGEKRHLTIYDEDGKPIRTVDLENCEPCPFCCGTGVSR